MKHIPNILVLALGSALLAPVALAQQAATQSSTTAAPRTSTTAQDATVDTGAQDQGTTSTSDMRSETDMSGWGMETQDGQATPPDRRTTGSSNPPTTDRTADQSQPTHARTATHSSVDRKALWGRLDTNGDGRISTAEGGADADFRAGFAAMDLDRDGYVSDTEYGAYGKAHAGRHERGTAGRMRDDLSGTGMLQDGTDEADTPPSDQGDDNDER